MEEEEKTEKVGYMCITDYYHEIGKGPVTQIYSSIKQLKREQPCAEECGIVKVAFTIVEVVQESKF